MHSFGLEQLKKYGWKNGKGLGKTEGIRDPLKPKLKFDLSGLGHDHAPEYTFQWWDHIYNKTLQNMHVRRNQHGQVVIAKKTEFEISTKKPSKVKPQQGNELYNYFVKGSILKNSKECFLDREETYSEKDYSSNLSDEQLLRICKCRTAHKAARHGLKMSAKLTRLKNQEIRNKKTKTNSDAAVSLGENDRYQKLTPEVARIHNCSGTVMEDSELHKKKKRPIIFILQDKEESTKKRKMFKVRTYSTL